MLNTTIILIAYNGDKWLPNCIQSLQNASNQRLHLILVDNSGNSIIDQLDLSQFDFELLTTSKPLGFAEANNFALAKASHVEEYVLFLNQDTMSPAGWIDTCTDTLSESLNVGALSPIIRNYDDTAWDPSFLDCLSSGQQQLLEDENSEQIIEVVNAPAPALFVRTDVLKVTGPFDPIYGSYYEDYDLCRRIREAGYSIAFTRDAFIRHYSGGSTQSKEQRHKRMAQIIRNRIIYEVRQSNQKRVQTLFNYFLKDFPRRLGRGIFNTPSSQPPLITIKAYLELLPVIHRLISNRIDHKKWNEYLDTLQWNNIDFHSYTEGQTNILGAL
ncbi:MAG: glycosyltransferase [Candidatus Marinimicrobia bacterium]|nr:glycosyltransferase [Candidatus Neomarinimicrobiota bacterium]